MLWAEGLSCQMEYKYLAHLTGRTEYFDKVEKIMTLMDGVKVKDGLFPTTWSVTSGQPMNGKEISHRIYTEANTITRAFLRRSFRR